MSQYVTYSFTMEKLISLIVVEVWIFYIQCTKLCSICQPKLTIRLSGVRRTILTFGYQVFMCAGVFFDGWLGQFLP